MWYEILSPPGNAILNVFAVESPYSRPCGTAALGAMLVATFVYQNPNIYPKANSICFRITIDILY